MPPQTHRLQSAILFLDLHLFDMKIPFIFHDCLIGLFLLLLSCPLIMGFMITLDKLPASPPRLHNSSERPPHRQRKALIETKALIALSAPEAENLLSTGPPTGAQYSVYFGRTPQERFGRLLESSIVGFLGVFFSYFLSFVIGGFFATLLGCIFFFWGILSPEFQAYQRNWEFLGGRPLVDLDDNFAKKDPDKAGLYSALFVGHIADMAIVEDASSDEEYDLDDFRDYNMNNDELEKLTGQPYLLRVLARDRTGRELQIHTRMSEEYVDGTLQTGLPVTAILLSTKSTFTRLAAITDLYVPDANLWLGDYPYLDREQMESMLAEDDDIWNALQAEAVDYGLSGDDSDLDKDEYSDSMPDKLVPLRRRRRKR